MLLVAPVFVPSSLVFWLPTCTLNGFHNRRERALPQLQAAEPGKIDCCKRTTRRRPLLSSTHAVCVLGRAYAPTPSLSSPRYRVAASSVLVLSDRSQPNCRTLALHSRGCPSVFAPSHLIPTPRLTPSSFPTFPPSPVSPIPCLLAPCGCSLPGTSPQPRRLPWYE